MIKHNSLEEGDCGSVWRPKEEASVVERAKKLAESNQE